MTAATTDARTDHPAPALPDPYDGAGVAAYVEHGRRKITLTLAAPGVLHRCRYERAWIDLTERDAWGGEPSLYATRQPSPAAWSREPFTDAARRRMATEVLPVVARYGFGRWWDEVHRRMGHHDATAEQVAQAARVGEWWSRLGDLRAMYAAGRVTLRPLPADERRHASQPRVDAWGNRTWCPVVAEALADGEPVGWLTERGELLPPRHLLDAPT